MSTYFRHPQVDEVVQDFEYAHSEPEEVGLKESGSRDEDRVSVSGLNVSIGVYFWSLLVSNIYLGSKTRPYFAREYRYGW